MEMGALGTQSVKVCSQQNRTVPTASVAGVLVRAVQARRMWEMPCGGGGRGRRGVPTSRGSWANPQLGEAGTETALEPERALISEHRPPELWESAPQGSEAPRLWPWAMAAPRGRAPLPPLPCLHPTHAFRLNQTVR